MDFKNFTQRELYNGVQYLHFFPNGYGVSIVRHDYSYSNNNTWELAVLKGELNDYHLVYNTPITDNVLSDLTDNKVNEICEKISKL
jgi:hypothetical protein